jgi:hypothetical protein
LLYIALYPPLPLPAASDERKEAGKDTFEPPTPSKLAAKQIQKSPLIPSAKATEAALRLLVSFAITNSPRALGRALPKCVSVSDWLVKEREKDQDQEEDAYIAREAMCIQEAKHVWAILKSGMIQRKVVEPMTPKGKGKKRRRDYEHMEEVIPIGGEGAIPLVVIAENAWPVLDWLLVVLERDELLMEKSGSRECTILPQSILESDIMRVARHSPILLSQIPPPRSGTGARWEADAPLDIVFYCLEQTAPKRRAMGARLITLVSGVSIDLSRSANFDCFPGPYKADKPSVNNTFRL